MLIPEEHQQTKPVTGVKPVELTSSTFVWKRNVIGPNALRNTNRRLNSRQAIDKYKYLS